MVVKDNIKRILFVVLVLVLPVTIVLNFVLPRCGVERNRAFLLTSIIIHFLTLPALVFWLVLYFYKDWLRKRIDTIKRAARWRIVVSVIYWLTFALLILVGMRFCIDVYRGSEKFVFLLIILLANFLLGYSLLYFWKEWQYCRKKPLCNILAASFVEQHTKFLNAHDFEKAYSSLVKACETAPDEAKLWCILASFCETFFKKREEADKYMARAEELITTKKAGSNIDKAYYFNYLGLILYERGEYDKGLEYMKQSIDIEPTPGRISSYKKKLSELKDKHKELEIKKEAESTEGTN